MKYRVICRYSKKSKFLSDIAERDSFSGALYTYKQWKKEKLCHPDLLIINQDNTILIGRHKGKKYDMAEFNQELKIKKKIFDKNKLIRSTIELHHATKKYTDEIF